MGAAGSDISSTTSLGLTHEGILGPLVNIRALIPAWSSGLNRRTRVVRGKLGKFQDLRAGAENTLDRHITPLMPDQAAHAIVSLWDDRHDILPRNEPGTESLKAYADTIRADADIRPLTIHDQTPTQHTQSASDP